MAKDNRLTLNGLTMQVDQMLDMLGNLEANPAGFVSDRTPLDAAAYLLADATASAGNPHCYETVVRYVEKAMVNTARLFDVVILVPPAIEFEEAPGKPPLNVAYQEHLHMLIRGMLFDDEIEITKGQLLRTNIDRHDRIAACLDFVAARFPHQRAA